MITKTDKKTADRLLKGANDIFALKIASNLAAYDGYDFCSVYGGMNVLIGRYYDDLVIRTKGSLTDEGIEELSLFLKVCGFKSALCGLETGQRLINSGWSNAKESVLLKFASQLIPENESIIPFEEITTDPPPDEVFPIVKDGFPDIDHDGWYTDINHKIRHGIAHVYLYGGATATLIADMNGTAYLTLLASAKAARGTGAAKNLLRALGTQFEKQGKEACVLCRDELVPFYNKAGFYVAGKAITIEN